MTTAERTTFAYRAAQPDGRLVRGMLESESRDSAVLHLLARGLQPVSLVARRRPRMTVTLGDAELALTLRVMAELLESGLPIARTLGNCLSAASYSRLLDHLGPGPVKDLLFTGRLISGEEAKELHDMEKKGAAEPAGATTGGGSR